MLILYGKSKSSNNKYKKRVVFYSVKVNKCNWCEYEDCKMNVSELLLEAGNLLLVGMCVVFVFLGILVATTKLLSSYAAKTTPATPIAVQPNHLNSAKQQVSPQIVAAISSAVHQYRKR